MDGYAFARRPASGPAWLGIRPEHVASGNAAGGMPVQAGIEVELFEPMGADTPFWTAFVEQPFHFRLDGQARLADGDRMRIGFDLARGTLLDRTTLGRL